MNKSTRPIFALPALAALLVVSACDRGDAPSEEATPNPDEPVSILRSDVKPPEPEVPASSFEPFKVVIGFPDGGAELDDAAQAALKEVLASEQIKVVGAPIFLRAHSDAGGSVKANNDAAEARGLAVAEWLIENGVDADRVEVIVFGAQNPAKPNALPNGEPDDRGRAANRRVEVAIVPPDGSMIVEPEPSDEAEPSAD